MEEAATDPVDQGGATSRPLTNPERTGVRPLPQTRPLTQSQNEACREHPQPLTASHWPKAVPEQDARSLCEPLVEVCLRCSKINKVPPELMHVNRGNGTEHLRNRTTGIVRSADATQGGSIGTKASALIEGGVDGLGNVADRRVLPNEWQQYHAEKDDRRSHLPSDPSSRLPYQRPPLSRERRCRCTYA